MALRISVITPIYRSKKWLDSYFEALRGLEGLESPVEVVLVDNDPRSLSLEEVLALAGDLDCRVLSNDRNEGFSRACNRGAREAKGELLLFLNADTRIAPDAARRMQELLVNTPGCGIVEARQSPREHPKFTWPDTGRVEWCSAACMLMRKDVFLESGGFDERFFMYGEDVDLSFRLADRGYKLLYLPDAVCTHHDGEKDGAAQVERAHHMIRADLLLRARYGSLWHFLVGIYFQLMRCVLHRKGRALSRCLQAFKWVLAEGPSVVMERWSGLRHRRERIFEDGGAFTLHHRFPEARPLAPPSGGWPSLSVVLTTENRAFEAEPLVESLLAQMDRIGLGELVVVDHGPSAHAAAGMTARFGENPRFHIVDMEQGAAAEARNRGLATATGDCVLFLDDRAICPPDLLLRHLALLGEHDFVQGAIDARWPTAGLPLARYLRDRRQREDAEATGSSSERAWTWLRSSHFSARRKALLELDRSAGVFHRHVPEATMADREFGWRLGRTAPIHRAEDLAILHRRRLDLPAFVARCFYEGFARSQIGALSPDLGEAMAKEGMRLDAGPGYLIRRLLVFGLITTPLTMPFVVLSAFARPGERLNGMAGTWFDGLAQVIVALGALWRSTGRKPPLPLA